MTSSLGSKVGSPGLLFSPEDEDVVRQGGCPPTARLH